MNTKFLIIATEYLTTNNNGACCVSDTVYHNCCGYSSVIDPTFSLSQCETVCDGDAQCKGYSTASVTVVTVSFGTFTDDVCIIYTTSSSSCPVKCSGSFNFGSDSLDQNALCSTPALLSCDDFFNAVICDNLVRISLKSKAGCSVKITGILSKSDLNQENSRNVFARPQIYAKPF